MGRRHPQRRKRDAVVVVFKENEKYLFIRRSQVETRSGYWHPVSGGVERGESQRDALVREVSEEIGVQAIPIKKVNESKTDCGFFTLHWWTARIQSGTPKIASDEIDAVRWMSIEQYRKLRLIFEEDIPILTGIADKDFLQ